MSEKITEQLADKADVEKTKKSDKGAALRIGAIIAVVAIALVAIIVSTTTKPPMSEQVWDKQTTLGDLNAKNYYVLYTDVMCPYCAVLAQTLIHNEAEFEQYLADNSILWEVRLTDAMYEWNGLANSRPAAEAVYCAEAEGKFWDYYRTAMEQLYTDYQSKGVGVSKSSPQITSLPSDYWSKIAKKVGLSDDFNNCLSEHKTVAEIEANTAKAAKVTNGMPSIFYNGKAGNVDGTNGWDTVKLYLDSGLKK